ncbi:MAG TPA: aminotransferase class V-fold PLP-dependent enzyme, partial [Ardenticatenaceae bacterium]|nr:aminotransferase class V-fold PLP-dependent enzyme [Ardenticatenaceae bacterium]
MLSSPRIEDTSTLRDHFLLHPDVVFLNHGSYGACPRPVFEAYQQWQLELERQPVELLGRRYGPLMRAAREVLAAYLHADPDDLVYFPNPTTALNVVIRSLALEPGDEVLTTNHEYGALDRTWRFHCRKHGAHYVNHPLPLPLESHAQVVEAVWSRVTPRTRVLFLSHITSPTALIFPVEELVRRAREAGILTIVDGAHVPGHLSLDLEALGVDFYGAACHKWLCAPKGSSFLYARREVQPLLEPLVVSWGYEAEQPGPSRFIDEHEYQGTRDIAPFLATPAAIEFQAAHDWPAVRARCHELVRAVRRRILDLTGMTPL